MSDPFLNFFSALLTTTCIKSPNQPSIDQGQEKKEQKQQHGVERKKIDDKKLKCEDLPEDLMIESILTLLPARTLAVCCCVSWCNSILTDSKFSMSHYIQNKNKLSLVFSLINVSRGGALERSYFFNLLECRGKTGISCFSAPGTHGVYELVGFCNGLACMNVRGLIIIVNPNRGESLGLRYVWPTAGYFHLCHGFGFDSLSQVYKAVIVFTSKGHDKFLCLVITLGTMSCRKIYTSITDSSPPPGSSPFPSRMVTRNLTTLARQATFCGGDLFWRTKNKVGDNSDKIQMLLSFDLHNEKIQFIRLPTECTPTTTTHERQDLIVDHLLEFKGYPCIVRSERITRSNSDHCGHHCDCQTGVCCCCYKVHMYMLKDKDRQVWTREETLAVQIMGQEGLPPTPLCKYFDASTAKPPTRILSFCDQVLLYWFNGVHLIFYNLQEKHLKVVKCSRSYPKIFQTKMNEDLKRHIGDDDNIHCPSMDYQLHAQVENIVSLKTFIPEGATITESDSAGDLMHGHLIDNNQVAGWLTAGRKKHTFSAFF